MTEAADQARAANAHFLRARISISDPALMDVVAGFAVVANAVEALAVQLGDMKQGFLFMGEKVQQKAFLDGWPGGGCAPPRT